MIVGGADLHLHSRHSDGSLEPAALVQLAADVGLEAISLTDHDCVAGIQEAREAGRRLGIRVLSGVELSAEFRGHEIHLLGYGFDPDEPTLLAALENCRIQRETRAEKIVARLNSLGIPLRLEQVREVADGAATGRPHLAEALLRAGLVRSFQAAFQRYLNPGCPGFIPREKLTLEAARDLLASAGGVLVLAHPHLNLSSDNIRQIAGEGMDGLETEHPNLKPSQTRELALLAAEREILSTGGTDYHGPQRGRLRPGSVRVPTQTLDRIEELKQRVSPRRGRRANRADSGRVA